MSSRDGEQHEAAQERLPLELARRVPLPGNRPIVRTNRDAQMEEFVGYMD